MKDSNVIFVETDDCFLSEDVFMRDDLKEIYIVATDVLCKGKAQDMNTINRLFVNQNMDDEIRIIPIYSEKQSEKLKSYLLRDA